MAAASAWWNGLRRPANEPDRTESALITGWGRRGLLMVQRFTLPDLKSALPPSLRSPGTAPAPAPARRAPQLAGGVRSRVDALVRASDIIQRLPREMRPAPEAIFRVFGHTAVLRCLEDVSFRVDGPTDRSEIDSSDAEGSSADRQRKNAFSCCLRLQD